MNDTTFMGLKNLKILELSTNRISQIESNAFRRLTKLTVLNLGIVCSRYFLFMCGNLNFPKISERNNLKSLDGRIFNRLHSLTKLMLSSNPLERLNDDDTFMGLNNLELLQLSWSQISQIEPDAFQGLTKLTRLDLGLCPRRISFIILSLLTGIFIDFRRKPSKQY